MKFIVAIMIAILTGSAFAVPNLDNTAINIFQVAFPQADENTPESRKEINKIKMEVDVVFNSVLTEAGKNQYYKNLLWAPSIIGSTTGMLKKVLRELAQKNGTFNVELAQNNILPKDLATKLTSAGVRHVGVLDSYTGVLYFFLHFDPKISVNVILSNLQSVFSPSTDYFESLERQLQRPHEEFKISRSVVDQYRVRYSLSYFFPGEEGYEYAYRVFELDKRAKSVTFISETIPLEGNASKLFLK